MTVITKGINTYEKKRDDGSRGPRRRIIAPPATNRMTSPLDTAIREDRTPRCDELFDECKCGLGVQLIALRDAADPIKAIQSYLYAVKAVASINNIEILDEVSAEALSKMTDSELKTYASKLLDKLN